jgi:L-ascorbate oxidase
MDFNKINNEEFYDEKLYSLADILYYNRTPLYTPQINNISMMLPETAVLYKWNSINRVKMLQFKIILITFLINQIFKKDMICNDSDKNIKCKDKEYCSCIYLLEFDIGDVVEFVVVDEGFTFQSNHPMHRNNFFLSFYKINIFI